MGTDLLPMFARSLLADAVAREVMGAFTERGVSSILLKGPTIAEWLYGPLRPRTYGDADIMIDPANWQAAAETLRALGYRDKLGPLAHPRMESLSGYPWRDGERSVDLHSTLVGVGVEPARCWAVLSENTEEMKLARDSVRVLKRPARTLHVALHAAQHGITHAKPLHDLALAVESVPRPEWEEVLSLAQDLKAVPALATGLRLIPSGVRLAESLRIQNVRSADASLRIKDVPLARALHELTTAEDTRARLEILRQEILPTPEFMRWRSPLARRGRRGMVAAYVGRWLWLLYRLPAGAREWRRAVREELN
jgi:hypothetical protein